MLWLEQSWFLLLVDVSVKSLALALIAWIALSVLRVQNANVRHRVWFAVLLAMVALPLLVPVTPSVPIPAWMMPPFPVDSVGEASQEQQVAQAVDELTPEANYQTTSLLGSNAFEISSSLPSEFEPILDQSVAMQTPVAQDTSLPPREAAVIVVPSIWSRTYSWTTNHWRATVLLAYVMVVLGFIVRIVVGIFFDV